MAQRAEAAILRSAWHHGCTNRYMMSHIPTLPRSARAIALATVLAAVSGVAAPAPQVKAPAGGTIDTVAVEGTIDVLSPGTQSLSVKTTDGTTQFFRLLEKVFVHGRTGADDELEGLERGMTVVVHYSGSSESAVAQEIDRIDAEGLAITEGQVTSIDRVRGRIKIRYEDGRTETLKLSNRVSRNVGRDTAANMRVVVYYTNNKGVKEVHYFKKKT
jgi:hypothetical protein